MSELIERTTGAAAAAAVDGTRLWDRLMEMATFGGFDGGGVNRPCLSALDIAARARLISWAKARGFALAVDDIANLYIRRAGLDAKATPVVTGSHMDSQPRGGRFDGIYGVLAGLEALEALEDAGVRTRRPIDVVAWTNEEGGRYAPGCMGSAVFAGAMTLAEVHAVTDPDGVRFGDALRATLEATPNLERRPFGFPMAAYVEAHIEQGPLLEEEKLSIGIVTGIQGARWFVVEVEGETGHAGTSPLRGRKDALRDALHAITALQAFMIDPTDVLRFTVGRLVVEPNSPNSIPAKVTFSIDFRHPDPAVLTRLGDRIGAVVQGAMKVCEAKVTETFHRMPSVFDPTVVRTIEQTAQSLLLPHRMMPSGAFHDAQFISEIAPAGMIFIPCRKGISHNPAEWAEPADAAAGTQVLAATLAELAK